MNRAQLELAAKLYALAMVAHVDGGESDEHSKVISLASKRARTKLRHMGIDPSEVIMIDDAIEIAQRLRPSD